MPAGVIVSGLCTCIRSSSPTHTSIFALASAALFPAMPSPAFWLRTMSAKVYRLRNLAASRHHPGTRRASSIILPSRRPPMGILTSEPHSRQHPPPSATPALSNHLWNLPLCIVMYMYNVNLWPNLGSGLQLPIWRIHCLAP